MNFTLAKIAGTGKLNIQSEEEENPPIDIQLFSLLDKSFSSNPRNYETLKQNSSEYSQLC